MRIKERSDNRHSTPDVKPVITLFGVPKPFEGHIDVIQRNAILSWCSLKPAVDVVLFGDEKGCAEIARDLNIRHVPHVERNEYGTPLISDIFKSAEVLSETELICYLNSDIMLTSHFLSAATQAAETYKQFLLIGRRWDVDLKTAWDFARDNWEETLLDYVAKNGKVHGPWGIDYFVFSRGLWKDMPPFALGRPGYDNWLIYKARSLKVPVVDGSAAITAAHQNHDYSHFTGGEETFWNGPEAKENMKMIGGEKFCFNTLDATSLITPAGIKPALSLPHLRHRLKRLSAFSPRAYAFLVAPAVPVYRLLKKLINREPKP